MKNYKVISHESTDRSIKEHSTLSMGSMTEQTEWWKGLGEELETDIETFDE